MRPKKVVVNDKMQQGYVYCLTEPQGQNFAPEFPKYWFVKAKLSPQKYNPKLNYFQIHASQSLWYWQAKGWLHPDDPRGWFQWYCRYYLGRRYSDDQRQIKRWRLFRRHLVQVKKNCSGKLSCRRRQRQALLHWAYDSRKI